MTVLLILIIGIFVSAYLIARLHPHFSNREAIGLAIMWPVSLPVVALHWAARLGAKHGGGK